MPVVCTYQGAGIVPGTLHCFGGRVGPFRNQIADELLADADVVITIGYYPMEYEPGLWNSGLRRTIIHIDCSPAEIDRDYRPQVELRGNILATPQALTARIQPRSIGTESLRLKDIAREREKFAAAAAAADGVPIHPTRLVYELQKLMREDMTVCLDMGSFHIWVARYLVSFRRGSCCSPTVSRRWVSACHGPSPRAWSVHRRRCFRFPATADSFFPRRSWRQRSGSSATWCTWFGLTAHTTWFDSSRLQNTAAMPLWNSARWIW